MDKYRNVTNSRSRFPRLVLLLLLLVLQPLCVVASGPTQRCSSNPPSLFLGCGSRCVRRLRLFFLPFSNEPAAHRSHRAAVIGLAISFAFTLLLAHDSISRGFVSDPPRLSRRRRCCGGARAILCILLPGCTSRSIALEIIQTNYR